MHRAFWAVLVIGSASLATAQDQRACKAQAIPDAKLREIAIAERNKAARSVSKGRPVVASYEPGERWAWLRRRDGAADAGAYPAGTA